MSNKTGNQRLHLAMALIATLIVLGTVIFLSTPRADDTDLLEYQGNSIPYDPATHDIHA
jgi:hypothetical protein